jgi:hypothetical protein
MGQGYHGRSDIPRESAWGQSRRQCDKAALGLKAYLAGSICWFGSDISLARETWSYLNTSELCGIRYF